MADDEQSSGDEPGELEGDSKKPGESSAVLGILGFILALGVGFGIGQVLKSQPDPPGADAQDDTRYKVALRGDEPQRGPDDALVTIIEFADYQCPFCAKAAEPLEDALAEFPEDVRLIYKHFPLPSHRAATPAAKAAWAAHQQGKFWPMHGLMFETGGSLGDIDAKAEAMGLDVPRFNLDRGSPEAASAVDRDLLAGARLGITGTPAFIVNGHRYTGFKSLDDWKAIVGKEMEFALELVDDGVARAEVYDKLMETARTQRRTRSKDPAPGELDPELSYRVTADGRPALGPDDALVTIVVFSDFQCPLLRAARSDLARAGAQAR